MRAPNLSCRVPCLKPSNPQNVSSTSALLPTPGCFDPKSAVVVEFERVGWGFGGGQQLKTAQSADITKLAPNPTVDTDEAPIVCQQTALDPSSSPSRV